MTDFKGSIVTQPVDLFKTWFDKAAETEDMPEAVALATADARGRPSARMVLLKGADERGFTFYTNLESRKGQELAENKFAALCFHWKTQKRQIRVEGPVVPVSDAEADAYFASRAKDSKIGAWASKQSRPMTGRFEFEAAIAKYTAKYAIGEVPRPPFWSGFRIEATRIEFWEDRKFRLHMRHVYEKDEAGNWTMGELYP
ncbi:pyridoxamine 5'-phosphate oxidase [Paremcibacter congregatus]|uniref:pyridoxamine 5'-phosphate oxidase n=1 Tax=Paremcibacter congregatus TaxID=2043170 RepID=UPI003A946F7D|tara:strand:+ start:3698 stop:4297 length:600 start_codon:yes stop_codon:yes gene_type:complete